MRRFGRALASLALVGVLSALLVAVQPPVSAEAAGTAGFDAGNIIDDSVFWNPTTMSTGSIQNFLNSRVPSCRAGYTCLKDYRQDTRTIAATPMCDRYEGAAAETAAQIIYKVAQACGVNPQVLLVMLQKEQGLVTDTWPTVRQYRSAMGAACPDTAPCDSTYYGFFDQVHYGAYLLRRYTQPPGTGAGTEYSTRFDRMYPVNVTSNVQYNPNASCGTQPVYVANQATHALYVYTPYTPNTAALDAGYGLGDGCSAYGNRNFYLYFTQWFGSVKGSDLVRTASDPTVYLITAEARYRVTSREDVNLFAPLGGVQLVAPNYLDRFPVRGDATGLVRNDSTGEIFFVGEGRRYYATSCEQIAAYGRSCSVTTSLTAAQISRFADGGAMGDFFKAAEGSTVYLLENGTKRAVIDWPSYVSLSALRAAGNIGVVAPAFASGIAEGAPVVGPARLVKSASRPEVWFIDGYSSKRHVTSFDLSRDIGAGVAVTTVSQATLDGYATKEALDTNLVRCGADTFVGAGGGLVLSGDPSGYGTATIPLDPITCTVLPRGAGRTGVSAMAVQQDGSPTVFLVSNGSRRAFSTWNAYLDWAASTGGTILRGMSATGLARWNVGPAILEAGSLVKSSTDSAVYVVDGASRLVWLRSFALATDLGIPTALTTLRNLDGYAPSGELALPVVECGIGAFVGDAGGKARTTALAQAGLTAVTLEDSTCSRLTDAADTGEALFVKADNAPTVYFVDAGQLRRVGSWERLVQLAGTGDPRIIRWSAATLGTLPVGPSA